MKFIIDAQLPYKLSVFLNSKGHDCIHTNELPKGNFWSDEEIIRVSVADKRIVITKDNDFFNSYFVAGMPEKLIVVSTGNISNKRLMEIFQANLEKIILVLEENCLIQITQAGILVHH